MGSGCCFPECASNLESWVGSYSFEVTHFQIQLPSTDRPIKVFAKEGSVRRQED